ncbi:MAG: hypothetical protein ACTSUE_05915 [Promethearchaeota archaeon]
MMFVPIGIIALAMVPGALRTKKWYLYALKVDFIFLVSFVAMVPNPTYWGSQIVRRLDHRRIITPDDPVVQALNDTGNLWSYISSQYGGATPSDFEMWTVPTQAYRVYRYIRSFISYTYDIDNQHVFDYAATPREVIANGQDDCQGISCLTVSLLIYLGYDARVCEVPFHWYIRVYYNTTEYCDIYRGADDPEPFYIFNQDSLVFPESFFWTLNTIFSDDYISRKYFDIVDGNLDLSVISDGLPETNIPPALTWLLVFGACLLAGLGFTSFSRISSFKKLSLSKKVLNVFVLSGVLFLGFVSILFVRFEFFLATGLAFVGSGVFLVDSGMLDAIHEKMKGKIQR